MTYQAKNCQLKTVCFDNSIQYLTEPVLKVSVSSIMIQFLDTWLKLLIFIFINITCNIIFYNVYNELNL